MYFYYLRYVGRVSPSSRYTVPVKERDTVTAKVTMRQQWVEEWVVSSTETTTLPRVIRGLSVNCSARCSTADPRLSLLWWGEEATPASLIPCGWYLHSAALNSPSHFLEHYSHTPHLLI